VDAPRGPSYELGHHHPLVVLAAVGDLRNFERVAADLARDFPGERFIGIVSADRVDDIDFPLRALSILLAEVIFTASSVPSGVQGTILASRALDVIGMGQDFVFTVPRLGDAVRYALDKLAGERSDAWEGTGVVVVGPPRHVDEVRRVLHPAS